MLITDILRSLYFCLRYPIKKDGIFGVICISALPGEGKTLFLTNELENKRKNFLKHKKEIEIYTNFGYKNETEPLESIEMLYKLMERQQKLHEEGKTVPQILIGLDELTTMFNARKYQDFPIDLIMVLCGSRHLNTRIYYTCQSFDHVDKYFRDLTNLIIQMKKINSYLYLTFAIQNKANYLKLKEKDGLKDIGILNYYTSMLINPSKPIWNLYDTHASMESIRINNKNTKKNKEVNNLKSKTIDIDLDVKAYLENNKK